MLTFALGAYAVIGDMRVAAALAVVTTAILALREPLHGWVENLAETAFRFGATRNDIRGAAGYS